MKDLRKISISGAIVSSAWDEELLASQRFGGAIGIGPYRPCTLVIDDGVVYPDERVFIELLVEFPGIYKIHVGDVLRCNGIMTFCFNAEVEA